MHVLDDSVEGDNVGERKLEIINNIPLFDFLDKLQDEISEGRG